MSGLIRRIPPEKWCLCHLLFAQLELLEAAPLSAWALAANRAHTRAAVTVNLQPKQ